MQVERQTLFVEGLPVFERIIFPQKFNRAAKAFHGEEACFMFFEEGGLQVRTQSGLINFNKDDVMLAKCGSYLLEEREDYYHSDGIKEGTAIAAYFHPKMVREFFNTGLKISELGIDFEVKKIDANSAMKIFLASVSLLFEDETGALESMLKIKLKELILLLSKTEQAQSIQTFVNSLFDPVTLKFENVINNNIYANLKVEELSYLCGLSLSSFQRKFKSLYGTNPKNYILKKRLERASELLELKPKSISEVAYDCGFNSISYFNTVFKKHYGVSPGLYRKTNSSKYLT